MNAIQMEREQAALDEIDSPPRPSSRKCFGFQNVENTCHLNVALCTMSYREDARAAFFSTTDLGNVRMQCVRKCVREVIAQSWNAKVQRSTMKVLTHVLTFCGVMEAGQQDTVETLGMLQGRVGFAHSIDRGY